jgi:diguanylate cyclase (GGDEF)-like protein
VIFWVARGALLFGGGGGVPHQRRGLLSRKGKREEPRPLTRLDAHIAASASRPELTPGTSAALRRDVQETVRAMEATQDFEVLDQILRDIRDLTQSQETIFWELVEARDTLVPSAWSTPGDRPTHFDSQAWSPLVRWSAEERVVHFGGEINGRPILAAAPVASPDTRYGVLTITDDHGLGFDLTWAREWVPRFAAQLVTVLELLDMRRQYGRQMRHGDALLDAVHRLHQARNAEAVAKTICDTARDVTSASAAALVRWITAEDRGVVQFASPEIGLAAGASVPGNSVIGRACREKLPIVLEDARIATSTESHFGAAPRSVSSLAIVPIPGGQDCIGAVIVEGGEVGDITQEEARNVGLLAALSRGPLEIFWEIEEVSRRARTDPLTGLANRRHFDDQLRRVIAETDRFGGTCSLIMIDLDHFKQVNDVYGHDGGDVVLKHVAQLFTDAVRTIDLCARYGGEEIAILLAQTGEQGAAELAERLREMLTLRPASYNGAKIPVTASFGVASYPFPVPYGDWLVLAADKALYQAKGAGRNCVKSISSKHVTTGLYKQP